MKESKSESQIRSQGGRTFIDWFIAVPAKLTNSGRKIELRMYEHHFYKADCEEPARLCHSGGLD
jgi:hypothetical protein